MHPQPSGSRRNTNRVLADCPAGQYSMGCWNYGLSEGAAEPSMAFVRPLKPQEAPFGTDAD